MEKSPTQKPLVPPPNWQADELTRFLETAHQNRWATFANKPIAKRLIALDACFDKAEKGLINPQHKVAALLLLRTHASYRAGCEHAMAGQVVETFIMIRACLESAGYALHMAKTPGADIVWLNRHEDEASLKAARKLIEIGNVRATILACNQKAAGVFDTLYQTAIDFGAHPNERAVTGSLNIERGKDHAEMQQLFLHGDGPQMDHALISMARAGLCALEMLQDVFKERFELLGIRGELLSLRAGL